MPRQSRLNKPGVLHHIVFIYHGAEVGNVPILSQQGRTARVEYCGGDGA